MEHVFLTVNEGQGSTVRDVISGEKFRNPTANGDSWPAFADLGTVLSSRAREYREVVSRKLCPKLCEIHFSRNLTGTSLIVSGIVFDNIDKRLERAQSPNVKEFQKIENNYRMYVFQVKIYITRVPYFFTFLPVGLV